MGEMAEPRIDLSTDNAKRWYVLILASVTLGLGLGAPTMCMPVLFKEMSAELGLNLVKVGTIWGVVSLGGFMMLLIGGMLGTGFGSNVSSLLLFSSRE